MEISTDKRHRHLDGMVRRAWAAKRPNTRDYRIRQYLCSFDARLLAALEAYDAMRPNRRPSKAKLGTIAGGLNPWEGTVEPVRVHFKYKDSHPYYRIVFKFGIENRALQYLVRAL